VAAVNSALQRARATLERAEVHDTGGGRLSEHEQGLLDRYVDAFARYDMDSLTSLIHEDATQSMPPYELWLSGRQEIFDWWYGPGIACAGSRVLVAPDANGAPAFGQYKPSETGSGWDPWALQVLEVRDGRIAELTFFLTTGTIFPLFGLPPRIEG
jgi:RNA polymerase sigma-70 factor (ECF subfamily)